MRKFSEPTARNLLRRPLVLGVPFPGLLCLSFTSLSIFVLGGGSQTSNLAALTIGGVGYGGLRIFTRFAKNGWEELILLRLERLIRAKQPHGSAPVPCQSWTVSAPDTLTELELIRFKSEAAERLQSLRSGENLVLCLEINDRGGSLQAASSFTADRHVYSLHQLPVTTDPLWLYSTLKRLPDGSKVIVRFRGVDARAIKRQIEVARRSNAEGPEAIRDIDSAVSFQEASAVLEAISRGDESIVEAALVITSPSPVGLDESYFVEEIRARELAVDSVSARRSRFHRSHLVRMVTAADLIPNIFDPAEEGVAILRTPRGKSLSFSPQDSRLEALHWLVAGASGSGKSFFTGLVLKRLLSPETPMSVLFVDHNRSFRRLVRSVKGPYLEPQSLVELLQSWRPLENQWDTPLTLSGIELSDLPIREKKEAIHALLSQVESFLRQRDSLHPFYLVLDECWNFMRDEPVLVQRAFREFRKLNGAVVAITQSLGDFLSDESGQSIFQNAPIRVLLRQGEDVAQYQGILGLNSVEADRLRGLRQERGVYSECLIKTPFLSRIGRLYPTPDEHALLRTDNLRAELTSQNRQRRKEARS